ncbi:hypothetical protein NO559_07855 [Dasania sp. GY-MA-18]|uniref:Uncharacterized protein n=1 Tax=Dasania phycosphaerae TaxID=2950436 RepID=A0A9J6RK87_9GAMM|nr:MULTISPECIES: hypothetical protein [Dasania]MCR8922680.1 hypothetical protein [Dasania sp. GY-MA-18]MCZ0865110.1 hypothetical protein [Dasania phycosphaerae]MCZ0868836.1 hypothetical protein [Dasania phycosphaerae]
MSKPLPACLTKHGITAVTDNLQGKPVQLRPGLLAEFLAQELYDRALEINDKTSVKNGSNTTAMLQKVR